VTRGDQPASGVRRRRREVGSVDGPPAKGDRLSAFVLVHGAGAGGWIWKKGVPLLRAAGHEVDAPTLTGCGERVSLAARWCHSQERWATVMAELVAA
jgi:alpha-beta hydrolase superfamily lysophospholipase